MHSILSRLVWVAVLCAVGGLAPNASAEPPQDSPEDPDALRVGVHDITSLIAGRMSFMERPPGVEHIDALTPALFMEEPIHPYGQADEVIELVKSAVRPTFWEETEGADIMSVGQNRLLVRATYEVHERVASFLASLDKDPTLQVDVCVVAVAPRALSAWTLGDQHDTLPAFKGPALRAAVTTTCGVYSTVFRGTHRLVMSGKAGFTSQAITTTRPEISMARYGLSATVLAQSVQGDNRATLQVQASLSIGEVVENTHGLDLHGDTIARWQADIVATEDAWHVAGTAGSNDDLPLTLFVRVHTMETDTQRTGDPLWLDRAATQDGPLPDMLFQQYNVLDLVRPRTSRWLPMPELSKPRGQPTETPEQPDPAPYWSLDGLVELVQSVTGEREWEDGTIGAYNGRLVVRNRLAVHRAIVNLLDTLRTDAHRDIVSEFQLYEVASDKVPEDRPSILKLLADTQPTSTARVRCEQGLANYVRFGTTHRFVHDYEIETNSGTFVAIPLLGSAFLGVQAQVRAQTSFRGSDALMEVNFTQQTLVKSRPVACERGTLDLPVLGVLRSNTTLRATLGKTTVVFRSDDGTTTRLVTVTPHRGD